MAEDAWMETCLVSISSVGGSEVAFQALTETVDFDLGEKDIEGVPLVNGGRVKKITAEGDSSVTLEAYPVQVGTDTGSTGKGFFDLMHTQDASQPISISNDHTRTNYRVTVLWTDDTTATSATQAIGTPYTALRTSLANGNFTSVKPSFTDGILKFTIVYKTPAYKKDASSNVNNSSTDGTIEMPALNAYTSSTSF